MTESTDSVAPEGAEGQRAAGPERAEVRAAPAADVAPDERGEQATDVAPAEHAEQATDSAPAEHAGAPVTPAAPAPGPRPVPRPPGRPAARPGPRPRHLPHAPHPAPHPPAASAQEALEAAQAAAWGRVDDDGTVWVREAAGERSVGQYPGADTSEALAFYVRRFLDLQAQVSLFEARLPHLPPKEAEQTLATLTDSLAEPAAVGDLDGLRARLARARDAANARRAEIAAEREAARALALENRTRIVEQAEEIAATDPARTQWRQAGERLHALLEEWKEAQRGGPRLDRASEDALWKRFSHARAVFDRGRRQFFSEVEKRRTEAREAKESIVAAAERLAGSTDWSATATEFRTLMDRWKSAGRAAPREDDALWERFRAAQDAFFAARNAASSATDAEFGANLVAKNALLEEAEQLVPIRDLGQARAALRSIQDRWDAIGKVPRGDVQRVEARLRAVEQAVRDAQQEAWVRTNPETRARAQGALAQLEASIAALESDLDAARAAGDKAAIESAKAALAARRAWLAQVRRTAAEGR